MNLPNLECYICKKPIYRRPSRKNNHNVCSYACRNKYYSANRSFVWAGGKRNLVRDRVSDKKRKLAYKLRGVEYLGGKCLVCGYSKCVAAIDFHHRDPKTKDYTIKNISAGSWIKIKNELDKCVVLCSNCHREHHWRLLNESETYKPTF